MFEIAAKIRLTVVKLTINFLFLNEDYLLTNELESLRLPRFKTSEGFFVGMIILQICHQIFPDFFYKLNTVFVFFYFFSFEVVWIPISRKISP